MGDVGRLSSADDTSKKSFLEKEVLPSSIQWAAINPLLSLQAFH